MRKGVEGKLKKLVNKFFQGSSDKGKTTSNSALPKLAELNAYKEVQTRALIGWLVYRLAAVAEIDNEQRDALFHLAFTDTSISDFPDESTKQLYELAESGVEWLKSNAVVEEELKALQLPRLYRENLSRLFSEVQMYSDFQQPSTDDSGKEWEVYRDVIYSATHGAFLLIDKSELGKYRQSKLLCEVEIHDRADISKARNSAKEAFNGAGLKASKTMSYNLIISEAVTNILKHAEYGKMLIYKDQDVFRVVIEDKGPGFPLKILPKTTLMAGFSTKESLGQGFTLMMKMAEQVLLETSSTGSTLILILDGKGEE
ncbi:ATP-binding protein [Oceanobacillus salinisoli]|uniref:ATP-binding protein n=1 Tax=Oceanobacillus salinisoli TaxID=2678611 RepID=UPI0012E15C62|nr:ATP-binding protein [Oceanobacillus salinisoli]